MTQTQPPGPDSGPMLYAATAFTGFDRAMPPLAGPTDPSLYVDPLAIRDRCQAPADDEQIQIRRGGIKWPLNDAERSAFDELNGKPAPSAQTDRAALLDDAMAILEKGQAGEADHPTDELPDWAEGLKRWWINTAAADICGSIPKIVEYGGKGAAYDLIATGHDLAALNGRTVGDEEAAELAVLSYLASKVNRMWAAAIDGRRGSSDTALDITFYSLMLRRIRAAGGWPVSAGSDPR